ncbi:DUF5686 family protein [uncultured Sunxiuqinia sp.]|uniref:DUF5686 family protein n=1 Tax=uncultured Sunxiuqinia sp. TaxID=1573825 RepID=UPI002AA71329|nr:DUF5686 family protein [uncultured Sunxiuqinia sp.]
MKLNKTLSFYILFSLILCAAPFQLAAQPRTVRVVDVSSSQPLPFVKALSDSVRVETTSNIDGYLNLYGITNDTILFYHAGYRMQQQVLTKLKDGELVRLQKGFSGFNDLRDKTISEDAKRVIEKVLDNRGAHQLKNINSYKYQLYNKLTVQLTDESRAKLYDSVDRQAGSLHAKLADQQDLYLQEGVRTKIYQKPDQAKEIVIADRTSGLKDSALIRLTKQLELFSFYQDTIPFFYEKYMSPISDLGIQNYLFSIDKKLLNTSGDSLFVISFKPSESNRVSAFEGVLTINSDGYAIESLQINATHSTQDKLDFSLHQLHNQLPSGQWFPKSMVFQIGIKNFKLQEFPSESLDVQISGKSFITGSQLNIPFGDSFFERKDSKASLDNEEQQQTSYAPVSVGNPVDGSAVRSVDILGLQIDKSDQLKLVQSLSSWRYPVGKVDILLDRLVNYNRFEGFQLGLGFQTNQDFNRFLSLKGYYRYGFLDDESKFGGDLFFRLDSASDSRFFVHYENDIKEDGSIDFLEQPKPFISQQLDVWYRTHFTYHEIYQAGFVARILPSFISNVYWKNYQLNNPTFLDGSITDPLINYHLVGVQFRLTFKEKLFRQRGEIFSKGGRFPVIHFNFERALDQYSDRPYQAVEFKLNDSYMFGKLGESEFTLLGSLRKSGGVMNLLASPPFSRSELVSNYNDNSFATMRVNEFVTDQLLAFFWRHNLGPVLFRDKQNHPDIFMVFNAGVGKSEYDDQINFSLRYTSIPKGYYEAGLLGTKLVRVGLVKLGAGAFYRLGPYQLESFKDNLSLKFKINLAI